MTADFATAAAQLAGSAGALLGWAPDRFWNATPAELAVIVAALAPDEAAPADATTIARLKEAYPDG